ncbi:MAG TPA: 2'-5' RNA ligase family protein [Brevundimonas sp.]|jgi:2'-5' RNA ligase
MPDLTPDLFGEARAPADRLFLAIFPDAEAVARIAEAAEDLRREHGLKRLVHPLDHLHITLFHLGDFAGVPRDLVRNVSAAAEAMKVAPFEVTFDHATSFPGRPGSRPFVLKGGLPDETRLAELNTCRQALGLALAAQGVRTTAAFTPHITLLYDDPVIAPCPIDPISWTVNELVLVRSHIGKNVYEHIGRWPLQG